MKNIDWQTRIFRITFFPTTPTDISVDYHKIWKKVSEVEPEFRRIPREQKQVFIGDFDDDRRIINENSPTRVDWYFRLREDINSENFSLTSLGEWKDNIEYVKEIGNKIIDSFSFDIKRIAFGVIFFSPNNSLKRNQQILFDKLPVNLKAKNYNDFLFQINDPIKLKIGERETRLNRLSKWGMLTLEGQKVSSSGEEQDLPIQNYCQVEIDVNTDKSNEESLSKDELKFIFEKSIFESGKIITDGISSIK